MRWDTFKIKEVAEIKPPKKFAKVRVGEADLVSVVPMEFLGIATKFFSSRKEAALEAVYSKYVYFEDDDVVMAKITPCFENGKIGVAKDLKNGIGFGSSEFIPFRCSENLHPVFLYHFMDRKSFRMEGSRLMTGAVGHKRIPKDFYEEFMIPIPPLEEQERIVVVLDKAFAAIDKAKANIERNLTNARELFQSRLREIFSNPSEDWKLRKIKEVALIRPPKKLAKSRVGSDELVSVVPMECLGIDKKFFGSEKEGVLENVYSKYVYFEDDDVVIAKITPCFENGKIGVASGLRNGIGFGSSEFIPFRCNEDLCPAFLYHFMNRDSFRNEGSRLMTGAVGHKRIPKDFYEEFSIPIPPLGEQERIVRELDSLDKMKRGLEMKYQTELDNFEEIRQSILEQAFEGKLTKPVAA
ncbi:restriction endonuclease subunit S [Flavobacteriales bacterium]|nr:restriction endonuclease subunit S [Flavobacteriales bacterium]